MYLASIKKNNGINYVIRISLKKDDYYTHKDLFFIGKNPLKFVHFAGRNAFYIDELVIDKINKKGVYADQMSIEHMFMPFLPFEIRSVVQAFQKRSKIRIKIKEKELEGIHPFDKFRLYYLKFQDQRQTYFQRLPLKFFSCFAFKSRDEIEQYFITEEKVLSENQIKDYLFASFNLKYYFSGYFKRIYPELCPEDELDNAFLEQICNLNSDQIFFKGMPQFSGLHDYLKRYAAMFFDSKFYSERINEEILENFINRNRKYKPLVKKPEDIYFIEFFGETYLNLKKLDKKEIKKIFRKNAMKLHPDKGGNNKKFAHLCDCYKSLMGKN